jgi:hypothetical protein
MVSDKKIFMGISHRQSCQPKIMISGRRSGHFFREFSIFSREVYKIVKQITCKTYMSKNMVFEPFLITAEN